MMKTEGPPVQYLTWSTMEEQRNKLEKVLGELDSTGVCPESITILSPKKREDSVVSMLEGRKIKNYAVPMGMNISFSTIHSFKGLENTIIIMTDIDSFASDKLMYVGLSRACSGLFILMSDGAKREYDNLLIRRLLK